MSIEMTLPRSNEEPDIVWHALTPEQAVEQLETPLEEGLSSESAARRLQHYGLNKLNEAPGISFWRMLLDQFNSFVVIMLIVAAIVSALLGDWEEAAAILAIVILNAALGVIQ